MIIKVCTISHRIQIERLKRRTFCLRSSVQIVHLITALLAVSTVCLGVRAARSTGKKRILIHVPLQVKQHHHTHTVYKHIVHEHDHEHQHHGESHPGAGVDVSEETDGGGGEYASGSNADYKVLGYTYGADAEPVLRVNDDTNGDSDEESGGGSSSSRSTLRDYAKWAPSRPVRAHRRPSSSTRYRDNDESASSNSGGRGANSHRGYAGPSTRGRPHSSYTYKEYRPSSGGGGGGKGSVGRPHYHQHHSSEQDAFDGGSPEDDRITSSSSSSSHSEEHWDEDRK